MWDKSKRLLISYLNQTKNSAGVPLYYIIRDPDLKDKYRADNGTIGDKIYNVELKGIIYEKDAFKVMQILRQWTSGGTADTYTDRTKNIQDAGNEMVNVFEGVDVKGVTIQRSRDIIRDAYYTRDTQNFKFAGYYTKHITANNALNMYSANVDGESQVHAFLRRLADAGVNPHLLRIKTTILTGIETKSDIYKTIITFKDTVRNLGIMTTSSDTRRVAAVGRGGR